MDLTDDLNIHHQHLLSVLISLTTLTINLYFTALSWLLSSMNILFILFIYYIDHIILLNNNKTIKHREI